MRTIALSTATCLLAACATTPASLTADPTRCDALAGDDRQPTAAPDVAAELLTLAHVTAAPERALWYLAPDGARAACLPAATVGTCGHVLHTFQPQVHRMWAWSGGATRREACAD
ncbi:hypothetical protein CNR27_04140 [Luteimonas chenhongjianii]|uniref:Lipoprotein n=1 Tax=Luteimonas chenhongjianii TaxID=2006110 RepID=A0A290XC65_9GAMM|nr:hypothetical protein [Luteimonas chenhongjianii]ATD66735.1 hypothetical protein CNR27_04140 [Luteimonas chenhongjianii]